MPLIDDLKPLMDYAKWNLPTLGHNKILFDIYEGDLLKYVLEDLKNQLSPKSYEQVQHRASPINILIRLVDKLSKIYTDPPIREIKSPAPDKDKAIVDFYSESYDINTNMGIANEFFNMFKNTLVEPYLDHGKPSLRTVPSDRFLVYSNDPVTPTRVTHLLKVMGTYKSAQNQSDQPYFYLYTDNEFLIVDAQMNIMVDKMIAIGNPEGINPYGKIPAVYINRSRHCIMPKPDTDLLRMTKIFPVLLSDLNFAVMFQTFSIMYGIDLDEENLAMSPNAFWRFKSDPSRPDSKPSVGVIKPEVDVDKVLQFIYAQLAFWLNSRNIRPGTIGAITSETFPSGISKAIDDMDTFEDRKKQIPYFKQAERDLWDLTINHMHPVWMNDPEFQYKVAFSRGVQVSTIFPEQKAMRDQTAVLDDGIKKINNKLATREMVLKELYPDADQEQIGKIIQEIDKETTVEVNEVDNTAFTQIV